MGLMGVGVLRKFTEVRKQSVPPESALSPGVEVESEERPQQVICYNDLHWPAWLVGSQECLLELGAEKTAWMGRKFGDAVWST